MGAINYGTSDYITIGYNCGDIDHNEVDYDFFMQDDYDTVKNILSNYSFYYFHVSVEPGYYEGFYIDIEFNYPLFFQDYTERKEAQQEITTIRHVLKQIVENTNCCAVYPGWCMGYADYSDTLSEIDKAAKQMRQHVHDTPTYRQYARRCEH